MIEKRVNAPQIDVIGDSRRHQQQQQQQQLNLDVDTGSVTSVADYMRTPVRRR